MEELNLLKEKDLENNSSKILENLETVIEEIKDSNTFSDEKINEYEVHLYEAKIDQEFQNFIQIDKTYKSYLQPKFYYSSKKKKIIQENLALLEIKREEKIANFKKLVWAIPNHMNKEHMMKLIDTYFLKFENITNTKIM